MQALHTRLSPGSSPQLSPARRGPGNAMQRGLSIVESLATVAILGLSISTALPGLVSFSERQRLKAVASQVGTDLQHARSAAVAADEVLRLDFGDDGLGGCYVLHNGDSGQCSCSATPGVAACTRQAQARGVYTVAAKSGLRLQSNVASMAFSPTAGTVTPAGTLRLVSDRVGTVHLVVNVMGRVRSCSPNGASGYRPC